LISNDGIEAFDDNQTMLKIWNEFAQMNWSFGGVFISFTQCFSKIIFVLHQCKMHKRRLQFLTHVHLKPYETYNLGDMKMMTIIDHLQREFQHVVFDNNNWSCVKNLHLGYMKIYLGNMKILWMKNL
jgi:hypothetical protein